jgi:hypothetical protein
MGPALRFACLFMRCPQYNLQRHLDYMPPDVGTASIHIAEGAEATVFSDQHSTISNKAACMFVRRTCKQQQVRLLCSFTGSWRCTVPSLPDQGECTSLNVPSNVARGLLHMFHAAGFRDRCLKHPSMDLMHLTSIAWIEASVTACNTFSSSVQVCPV